MEMFFMLSAMLALIVPIVIGRVRCIRVTPRLLQLYKCIVPSASLGKSFLQAGFSWAHEASWQLSRHAHWTDPRNACRTLEA